MGRNEGQEEAKEQEAGKRNKEQRSRTWGLGS